MKQVMLHRVIKLLYILLFVSVASCKKGLSEGELKEIREDAYKLSSELIGIDNYNEIYQAMNDSIKSWADNGLGLYKYYKDSIIPRTAYQIDSIICFNTSKDKCLTGLLLQIHHPDAIMDDIQYFYGTKINGQWYFFAGATMGFIRERYQKNIHTPLSFDKLKQFSARFIFRHYFRKASNRELVINDAFFNRYYKYDAYNNPFTTQAECDSSWLKACRENWSERNKR